MSGIPRPSPRTSRSSASPPTEDAEFPDELVVDVAPHGYSVHRTDSSPVGPSAQESTPGWYEYAVKPIDEDFCSHHLVQYKFDSQNEEEIYKIVNKLQKSDITKIEPKLYPDLSKLLTIVSEEIYESLSADEKRDLEGRLQALGHLEFIENRTNSSLKSELPDIGDEADLFAVVEQSRCSDYKGQFYPIPHHYIETLVEVRADDSNALRQAATYAYQHQGARPDHPAFLCLIVKPKYYQILLSEPSGVIPSSRFPWTQLTPLASFLYTIYIPPQNHFFHDTTMRWSAQDDGTTKWNITTCGQEYTDGRCIILGDAWGRRTCIYYAVDGNSHAIIKEYYLNSKRRFDEAELLNHIHADSDVPGVVRLKSAEDVKVGDTVITCGSEEAGDKRTKRRLVLYDVGFELSKATSINTILKVLYDVLEVHRTLVRKRGILHRDMSIHNILMAPRRRKLDKPVMKDRPPFIDEMLEGRKPEYLSTRDAMSIPRCLLIDFDNGSKLLLENEESTPHDELTARTGTPRYIARSVCLGRAFISANSTKGAQMPELSGRALELYEAVRGIEHYNRYNEKATEQGVLMHGGVPPQDSDMVVSPPEFFHRPEHDVESVFWTMFAILARAQPTSGPKEEYVPAKLRSSWATFDTHEIPRNPTVIDDKRDILFSLTLQGWRDMFAPFPDMMDIADLLFKVSKQVRPEYALWEWVNEPEPDHLHEAVQRLIFQYLVDHPDDIVLDPKRHRPVDKPLPNVPQLNPIRPQPLRGDDANDHGKNAASSVGMPVTGGSMAPWPPNTSAEQSVDVAIDSSSTRARTAGAVGSTGKAPSRASSHLQMPPSAARTRGQCNAEPFAGAPAGTEEGAKGTRSQSTVQDAGSSSSAAASGCVPPRASSSRDAHGRLAPQPLRRSKRKGGDREEPTGADREKRKR